jgi:alpha-mannosidase
MACSTTCIVDLYNADRCKKQKGNLAAVFTPNNLNRRVTDYVASAIRAATLLYHDAEWLNALAHLLGKANQQAQLNEGWQLIRRTLLPGETEKHDEQVQYIGRDVLTESLTEIVSRLPTKLNSGEPLIALNTLSWDRTDVIQVSADMRGALIDAEGDTEALTAERSSLLTQPVMDDKGNWVRLMAVRAPSYGYQSYIVRGGLPGQVPDNTLSAERQTLESTELRVIFDKNGEISSLFDKITAREMVAPGKTLNHLVTFAERPPVLDGLDIGLLNEEKPSPVGTIIDWRVTETGPIRAAIEITRQIGDSMITQKICLWAHTRRIDFVTEVNWHADKMGVSALFPLNIDLSSEASHIQYARYSPQWVDLSEADYGMALFSNSDLEHRVSGNVVVLTLFRPNTSPDPVKESCTHRFTYSLYTHTGDWREAEIARRAYELTVPLRVIRPPTTDKGSRDKRSINEGATLPLVYSFLRSSAANIAIETIKMADDGDGLIIYLYESDNRQDMVALHFAQPIISAVEIDIHEAPLSDISMTTDGHDLHFEVKPFELKAFRVKLS